MSGFTAVGQFIAGLFFSLLLLVLWVRMFLRFFKVSSLHPISQSINALTDPLVKPLSSLFHAKNAKPPIYDWACFTVIVIVELIKFTLLALLFVGAMLPFGYLILFVIADLVVQPLNLLFYILLFQVIMSWVRPNWNHPLADVIHKITKPFLAYGRSIIPDISGFDFSPFVILILLKVVVLFISASLPLRLI